MSEIIIQVGPAESTPMLPGIYMWGIEAIRVIQQIENPILTAFMKFITSLGSEYFFLPVVLFIFWWVDEKKGLRLGILILVSAWINVFLKEVLQQPRPFHIDPSLGLAAATGYGAPSGHALLSLIFWIPVAAWLSQVWAEKKRLLIWALSLIIVILIGFSRLYLGVHFPTDILAGWTIGFVILVLWFIPGPFLTEKLASANIRVQNISAAAVALIMNGLLPGDRTLPALFLGFCLGYNIMKQRFPFSAQGEFDGKIPSRKTKLFRCLVGFTGMSIFFIGLKFFLPGAGSLFANIHFWGHTSPLYETGNFIRYGILGFWVSAGAPYMFQSMRLALDCRAQTGKGEE